MARKGQKQPDRVSHHMQAIDDPTAAFPIAKLSELVTDDEPSGSEEDLPRLNTDAVEPLEESDDEEPGPPAASPAAVQIGYLLLSLLGGGILAAMFAAVIVVIALLL